MLLDGALKYGYSTDLWTQRRVSEVIGREFGIQYHPNHMWRFLTGLGWSCQKPEKRARERDEAGIQRGKRYQWPHIKNAERLGAHLVFLDESGFLVIPTVTRTWAPRGCTPILRCAGRRSGKISALSALSGRTPAIATPAD